MTVADLKSILEKEDDKTEVTICIANGKYGYIWKELKSAWRTASGSIVLGEK